MPALEQGIAVAVAASAVYAVGIVLQAAEARTAPPEDALRLALLRRLVARPRWLAGTALGLAGWALQALALTRAPLTVVQPLLGTSLVFVLALAAWRLGETVRARDVAATAAVAGGGTLLALAAPARDAHHAAGARLWLALGLVGAAALAPLALRGAARSASVLVPLGAGLAYAWDSVATKLASDDYAARAWLGLLFWFAAMLAASGVGTLSEMSALQRRPVARVAPLVFALTSLVPVALAPLVASETWPAHLRGLVLALGVIVATSGATLLTRSPAVGRVLVADARSSASDTPRSDRADSARASASSDDRPRGPVASTITRSPPRSS